MTRGRRTPPAPLEQRRGVDPVRLRLPPDPDGRWPTVRDHLVARFGQAIGPRRVDEMLRAGDFVTAEGPLGREAPYQAGLYVWFHREFAPEEPVPFEVEVVYRDERVVVADKPHFLATTPRGGHVTDTALARLRRDLGLPDLQPAHRLDRLTAGLVLFVVQPRHRGAYQSLFQLRRVRKEYRAVAAFDPRVPLPATVRSRIVKERGELTAREVPGEPNSESRVELLEHRAGRGLYRLVPHTGRTHQLRVHMNALGLPILGDPLYPRVVAEADGEDDYTRPLQLLAATLEYTDPVTGLRARFDSRRRLGESP
ncbi:pseudouridylate synthase [Streptomyces durbertensis]|uniref:RNA pseudouridylate synthase n=1 Tax=Streptomyces durbertensis TaxID=2448886 RepID=A0ABR6E9X9_9ACTN|nr:pseudouridine synthase [Streptomyces durbertensis]MBB1242136.1 pseudouridylate synthase [Streptomyces durbertensis]